MSRLCIFLPDAGRCGSSRKGNGPRRSPCYLLPTGGKRSGAVRLLALRLAEKEVNTSPEGAGGRDIRFVRLQPGSGVGELKRSDVRAVLASGPDLPEDLGAFFLRGWTGPPVILAGGGSWSFLRVTRRGCMRLIFSGFPGGTRSPRVCVASAEGEHDCDSLGQFWRGLSSRRFSDPQLPRRVRLYCFPALFPRARGECVPVRHAGDS